MIILVFGFCGIGLSRPHEFGDRAQPKMIRLKFLLFTAFIINRRSSWVKYHRSYCADSTNMEWFDAVRLARQKAKKKGYAEGRNEAVHDREYWMQRYVDEEGKKADLIRENQVLKNTIRGWQMVSEEGQQQ